MNNTQKLEALYARVPRINCKQKCQAACTVIAMTALELKRIGGKISVDSFKRCSKLTVDGGCSVYENRPMICRLWGVTENMPCPYGCVPERWLTQEEGYELLAAVRAISGKVLVSDMKKVAAPGRVATFGLSALVQLPTQELK